MYATPDASIPNHLTFEEVLATARELGGQEGAGRDVLIKSLLKCCEAGYHGIMSLQKNAHGPGEDDAVVFAREYFTARNAATVFDPKADNQQKLISTIRTAVRLGGSPKFGVGEPIATVNNLMSIYRKEKAASKGKVDSADNVFLKFARAQLASDTLYAGDDLKSFCYKKAKKEMTVEDYIDATVKRLDKLISGEADVQCKSPHILDARQALRDELSAIAVTKGQTNQS